MQQDLPQRRSVRLPGYDYGQAGWYFVTIVAKDRCPLFGQIGEDATVGYSAIGEQVCRAWCELTAAYPRLHADAWILMPNHLHCILGFLPTPAGELVKTLGQVVGALKATTTRLTRPLRGSTDSLWQRSYYEHVIRNAHELAVYREYIQNNPARWLVRKHAGEATAAAG
ncbi:transposase [Hymenobacter aquaticus]|nr:transposase [Hymenobacter aquaticus]